MFKIKSKLLSHLLFTVFALSLFHGCQKDDTISEIELSGDEQGYAESTTKRVSAEDIPEVLDYLNTMANNRGNFEINRTQNFNERSSEPDLVIGELQTDEIILVTNNSLRTNYTFRLRSIESSPDHPNAFFNLVVEERSGSLFSYITEYRPSSDWLMNFNRVQDMSTFSGSILYYKIDGTYVAQVVMQDGSSSSVENRTPCDPGDGGGGGGGGGDGGGGGGGGGGGDGGGGGGDTSGDPCTWFVIAANCDSPDDDCTTTIYINCGDDMEFQNSTTGQNLRTPCDNQVDECFQDNTDPCPYGCNEAGDGCADAPDDNDDPIDIGVLLDLRPPCEKLNDLLSNNEFTEALSNIQDGAGGDSERGFEISRDEDGNISTNFVQGGFDSTPMKSGNDIIGGMHNHTEEYGYPLFSGDDIYVLTGVFLKNSNRAPNGNVLPGDVFSVMVSQNGTFGMTINNFFTLSTLLNNIGLDKLNRKLNSGYNKSDSPNEYLQNMLKTINKLLDKYDIAGAEPISLYKLNQDGTAFEEITLDENGELNPPLPCN